MSTARQIVLASRPKGEPTSENFRTETVDLPTPGDGELELKVRYLSLDPYMRGRMSDAKSYAAPVEVDAVMTGETISEVVTSNDPRFKPGDLVLAITGWVDAAVVPGKIARKVTTKGAPETTALGVGGMPGFTAWSGLEVHR